MGFRDRFSGLWFRGFGPSLEPRHSSCCQFLVLCIVTTILFLCVRCAWAPAAEKLSRDTASAVAGADSLFTQDPSGHSSRGYWGLSLLRRLTGLKRRTSFGQVDEVGCWDLGCSP